MFLWGSAFNDVTLSDGQFDNSVLQFVYPFIQSVPAKIEWNMYSICTCSGFWDIIFPQLFQVSFFISKLIFSNIGKHFPG